MLRERVLHGQLVEGRVGLGVGGDLRQVAAGADVELAEANGIRPLLMALLNDNLAIARLLLGRGADVNADDFWGRAPLFAAVEYRNLDMNNREQDSPTTNGVDRAPLLDMIALLVERGADVNARSTKITRPKDRFGLEGVLTILPHGDWTPMMYAARDGAPDAVRPEGLRDAAYSVTTESGPRPDL